jgi:predicted Fe-Mo cluster-binding NifX family protein
MKVAVSATGPTMGDAVEPRFGRCHTFLLVNLDDMSVEVLPNGSTGLQGGAGIQSAQLIARSGVKTVLTGHCGPNAFQALEAASIGVVVGCSGTVSEAITRYKSGDFTLAKAPSAQSHAGGATGGG